MITDSILPSIDSPKPVEITVEVLSLVYENASNDVHAESMIRALRGEPSHPVPEAKQGTDWGDVAMWLAFGAIGVTFFLSR